jgi:hypothetical protein
MRPAPSGSFEGVRNVYAGSTQVGKNERRCDIGGRWIRSRGVPLSVSVLVAVLLALPASACGSPLPGDVLVGFEDSYDRSGRQFTHHGLDVAMEAGNSVSCLHEGVVVFAGHVPAGPGQSTLAVTIEDDSGRRWSYLPFEAVAVGEGQSVAEGACMGALAAAGDASSAEAHLHLGLRIDGEYSDPMRALSLAGPIETDHAEVDDRVDGVQVAASVGKVDAGPAQPPVLSSRAGSTDAPSLESAPPIASPRQSAHSSHVPHGRTGLDPLAVATRDREQSWWASPAAPAPAGAGLSDVPAMLTIAMLGLAMLSGVAAGAVHIARDHAPVEVGADPGSTRLQPW